MKLFCKKKSKEDLADGDANDNEGASSSDPVVDSDNIYQKSLNEWLVGYPVEGPRQMEAFFKLFPEYTCRANAKITEKKLSCNLATTHQVKNRYSNIFAYDQNRVMLRHNYSLPVTDYVNASPANMEDGRMKYILSQAPLMRCLADFFDCLFYSNVDLIVMLTQKTENLISKVDDYFDDRIGGVVTDNVYSLTTESLVFENSVFIHRKLKFVKKGEDARMIDHLEMKKWADHGVPALEDFLPFYVYYRALRYRTHESPKKAPNVPTLVHCSAGVGRTGCFVVFDTAMRAARFGVRNVTMDKLFTLLRVCRDKTIQTHQQFGSTWKMIVDTLKTARNDVEVPEGLSYDVKSDVKYWMTMCVHEIPEYLVLDKREIAVPANTRRRPMDRDDKEEDTNSGKKSRAEMIAEMVAKSRAAEAKKNRWVTTDQLLLWGGVVAVGGLAMCIGYFYGVR